MQKFILATILALFASAAQAQGYVDKCKAESNNNTEVFDACVALQAEAVPFVEKYVAANKGTEFESVITVCVTRWPDDPYAQFSCMRDEQVAIQRLKVLEAKLLPEEYESIYAACTRDWGTEYSEFIADCIQKYYDE